jgi:nitrite reductase/ring-hydroxylating ferredoxin subunit
VGRRGQSIALYWIEGGVYATSNVCTHADARLSDGHLDGHCIECPAHQALFDVRSGEAVAGPADVPLKTFACRLEDGASGSRCEPIRASSRPHVS